MMSPFVMVIFGATGDLARNKLIPALFSLYKQKQLGEKFYVVGFARRPFTDEEFRDLLKAEHFEYSNNRSEWDEFAQNLYYQQGDFGEEKGYTELIAKLNGFDAEVGACITRLFYLATPPDNYAKILDFLDSTKLSEGCGQARLQLSSQSDGGQGFDKWTKLIIEKPFGKDIQTARALDKKLSEIFSEEQIFRVDHYLGKETVQNIIAFRFANGIFDPVWNKNYIDNVQITLAESGGIGTRGGFYDGVGNLRDVGQNHLLQLLAAVAMEQPASFSKEGLRDARAKAMKAIRPIKPSDVPKFVVRGQYRGYKEEKNVAPASTTETFAAMKLFVDTPRFVGVPFYLRAGKKMAKDDVSISIVFIQTCHLLFKEYGCPEEGNILKIRIQPDEGITMRVIAKKPGSKVSLGTVDMQFSYKNEFGGKGIDAYEKILLDIFAGDQMLFNRSDELESSWEFITNILTGWSRASLGSGPARKDEAPLYIYEQGSAGPQEAEKLLLTDGKKWV